VLKVLNAIQSLANAESGSMQDARKNLENILHSDLPLCGVEQDVLREEASRILQTTEAKAQQNDKQAEYVRDGSLQQPNQLHQTSPEIQQTKRRSESEADVSRKADREERRRKTELEGQQKRKASQSDTSESSSLVHEVGVLVSAVEAAAASAREVAKPALSSTDFSPQDSDALVGKVEAVVSEVTSKLKQSRELLHSGLIELEKCKSPQQIVKSRQDFLKMTQRIQQAAHIANSALAVAHAAKVKAAANGALVPEQEIICFAREDRDGDGVLNRKELPVFLQQAYRTKLTDDVVERLFCSILAPYDSGVSVSQLTCLRSAITTLQGEKHV